MLNTPRWQVWSILGVTLLCVLLALPNLLPRAVLNHLPHWYAGNQINLGLDLRGGVHLLLDVDVRTVLRQNAINLADTIRPKLREKAIQVRDVTVDGMAVNISIRDEAQAADALQVLRGIDSALTVERTGPTSFRMGYSEQEQVKRRRQILEQSIEVLRRRIDESGTKEPSLQIQGDDGIVIQVPGVNDPAELERLVGKTARLSFRLADTDWLPGQPTSARSVLLPTKEGWDQALKLWETQKRPDEKELRAGDVCRRFQVPCQAVQRTIIVGGEDLTGASGSFDHQTGQPIVTFQFNANGGRSFCRVTTNNVGNPLAIVLDDVVISAPRINSAICGGSGIITGQFTTQQTNELALLLRAGALPATLTIVEKRTVGADLGADAIRAGLIASIVGTLLVVLFMFISYGPVFGSFANIAMVVNMVMVFAGMSVLGASLTLPGIAGLVLTVGMAVDSNVLIYERVREEQAAGRQALSALVSGYERALSAIIDANVTTLIAGVLMFGFGSGPIRGFATTLSLGLITSMFSSTIFTRMVLGWWLRTYRPRELVI
jgi:protein-export membrane protein SecD